jgi:hypothetical protein
MRYSHSERLPVQDHSSKSPQEFFEIITKETKPEERSGCLLLVGGRRHSDLMVRQAQAPLRLDRMLSPWSQASVILDWPKTDDPSEVMGVEVSLTPSSAAVHLPERNGVSLFRLSDYMDDAQFPNMGAAILCNTKGKSNEHVKAKRDAIHRAALRPAEEQMRFPLFDWIGEWQNYVYGAEGNPLLRQIPHPGAAFCEQVFRSANLDPTASATNLNTCPEVIWSSLLYWYGCLHHDKGGLAVFSRRSDSHGQQRYPSDKPSLEEAYAALKPGAAPAAARRARSTSRKKK